MKLTYVWVFYPSHRIKDLYNKRMKNKAYSLLKTLSLSFGCAIYLFTLSSQAVLAKDQASKIKILFLGDSLTEGYGVEKKSAYPYVAADELRKKNHNIEVINGSVSGSTTASGKSRLKWFSKAEPDYLFLALGANDMLRGIQVDSSQKNLSEVIRLAKEKGMTVILAGMMAPPNYGKEYGDSFKSMYTKLAKLHDISLVPFLLEGVAGEKEFNQVDGIHPNKKGHQKMGELVAKTIEPLLNQNK